ncbi:DOMON domain-containing protein [Desulfosediminicola sp.]|uniref:DOMON domain-containing protein n=1 Tax=Desulfosediminicola sp. TaxID=2886825 RepID=UPI003AF1F11D
MRNRLWNILIAGMSLAVIFGSQAVAAEYDHTVEAKNISFSWKIDGDNLAGQVSAKTEGWVGVGFNPSAKMKDANYVLGYVKDGKVTIVDEFGVTATGHKADDKVGGTENVKVVGGTEEGGMTTIEFVIPLNSGDEKDGVIDPNADTLLLLAYGGGRDSFRAKHKYREVMTVNLGSGEVK